MKEEEIKFKEENKNNAILITATLSDPKGYLIPRGVNAKLTATIADGVAVFYFSDRNITDRFARVVIALERNKNKNDTVYHQYMHKIATKYEHKTKEEIRDVLLQQLKELNLRGRK